MKIAERLLLEMSLEDARKVLDMTTNVSLDKAYKKAAMKHHPDRGGSVEMMQKVNQAYELLKAAGGGRTYSQMSDAERKAAWQAARDASKARKEANKKKMSAMLDEFHDRFTRAIPTFSEHFKEFFNLGEPIVSKKLAEGWSESWIGKILVVWPTNDNDTEIRFLVEIREDSKSGLTYDTGEPVYAATYETLLYHNRKDHKMARRHWQWGKTSSDALDPEKVFPKAKLKKVVGKGKTDKMTKKDFERALAIELRKYKPDFRFSSVDAAFNFDREDRIWITLHRMVWNRKPSWSLLFEKDTSPVGKSPLLRVTKDLPKNIKGDKYSFSFPETSTSVDLLKDFLNKFIANRTIEKDHFKKAWDKLEVKK